MSKKGLFILLGFILIQHFALAQKVKYKDLMVLLTARQYEQAEPHLKKFLKENDDNPSAYLFMAITYHEKSLKNDVLKQTDVLLSNIDSAIFFYDKTYPLITEKEIKRNDENYQMYSRRDLRTGEFGVKQSDVLLDIETRTKGLRERKEKVKLLKNYYLTAEAQYNRANSLYKSLQGNYTNKKELYLLSDDDLILNLEKLAVTFDSCQTTFKNYKSTSQAVGKTGYNQVINLQEIDDFKKDGSTLVDFMEEDLKLWNYSDWARKTIRQIKDEVYTIRQEILTFDSEINKIRETMKRDSIPVNTGSLKSNPVFNDLKKWDPDPMPAAVFRMKISELDYMSEEAKKNQLKGAEYINKKIGIVRHEIHMLKLLDSLSLSLIERDWVRDASYYKSYVTGAYGTMTVLRSLINSMKEFARREGEAKTKELEELSHSLKWAIDENDSIPLFMDVEDGSKFKPMVIHENYTAGVKVLDSTSVGYFYALTPARTADLKVTFPLDTSVIKSRNIPLIKGISLATEESGYFVVFYSESKIEGKTPVSIARISKKDGLEWTSIFSTDFPPIDLKFSSSSGELSIRTTSPDGDSKMVVLARDGKRLQ